MISTTLPLSLFAKPDFMSLKQRQELESQRQSFAGDISAVESFKSTHDSWIASLQARDNTAEDRDLRPGQVRVDDAKVDRGFARGYFSGQANTADGFVTQAQYQIETFTDSEQSIDSCSFQRTADATVYVETSSLGERTLSIDHQRGTLTFVQ